MSKHPTISVLIRTFNSERTLGQVLSGLNLGSDDECIVVDSGSSDTTLAIADRFGATVIELDPPFNYSRSLNEGFKASKGEYVMVISSHCIPLRRDLVDRMKVATTSVPPETAVIYGRIVLFDPGNVPLNIISADYTDWKLRRFSPGGNGFALYPKRAWNMRQFDENLITAEDLDWMIHALQNGKKAAFVSDACVLYRNQPSMVKMFKKGWNETKLAREFHGDTVASASFGIASKSFITNILYLTKSLVMGRLRLCEYFRMCSHGMGSFLANAIH